MEYHRYYYHKAVQTRIDGLTGSLEEDKVFIRIQFYEGSKWHRVRSDPVVVEYNNLLSEQDFWVPFSLIKQRGIHREYAISMSELLTSMGVPEVEHPNSVQKLTEVVEAAVSPVDAIVVGVWDITYRIGDGPYVPNSNSNSSPPPAPASRSTSFIYRPNYSPASTSFIEALEQVTLHTDIIKRSPSCAICLEDYHLLQEQEQEQEEPITGLPCRHYFHIHCIVQSLEINNMCPLCRYAMPKRQD